MKNIHLLPTDKPSRLAGSEYITNEQGIDKRAFKLKLWNKIISNKDLRDIGYIPQNTYITNDEKIKVGDWYLIEFNGLKITQCNSVEELISIEGRDDCKKIILTDNPDLIKDGVQPIDNEFLEWFVKNPSCESVEVNIMNKGYNKIKDIPYQECYKIIIPQEEPKQIKCYCGHTITCDCEPLQETLEEATERLAKIHCDVRVNPNTTEFQIQQLIGKGAKWQAKRMYSEEEVFRLTLDALDLGMRIRQDQLVGYTQKSGKELHEEWFEQSKKK